MKNIASVLCLLVASVSCSKISPETRVVKEPPVLKDPQQPVKIVDLPPPVFKEPPVIIDPQPPVKIVDPPPPTEYEAPNYDAPPFPKETTCYFFIPCFFFPTEPICTLPLSLCGGAYTFANSCYLSWYNCEHESNQYFEYCPGECYPKKIVDPDPIIL